MSNVLLVELQFNIHLCMIKQRHYMQCYKLFSTFSEFFLKKIIITTGTLKDQFLDSVYLHGRLILTIFDHAPALCPHLLS